MKNFKRFIKIIIKLKAVNQVVLSFINLIKPILPNKLKKSLIKIPVNRDVTVRMYNKKSFIMKNDGSDTIANILYWNGPDKYETKTTGLIMKFLKSNDVFFDIGANTGIYSLIAAAMSKEISVHAFEPLEKACKILKKNKDKNNFNNLFVNQIAVGSYDGEGILKIERDRGGAIPLGSSLKRVIEKQDFYQEYKVKTMRLDSYIEKVGVEKVDLIKIDTEGTENDVLNGAEKVLTKFRPVLICEVLHNLIEDKLHEILDSMEYDYYLISNKETNNYKIKKCDRIVGDKYIVSNYLFLPKEKSELVENYNHL